jgi:hypothetical protein
MAEDVITAGCDPEARRLEALARVERGELLTPDEMAAIFRMSRPTFKTHLGAGEFDAFRATPHIGRPLFSGVVVRKYLAGEPLYAPTFGRKRGTR